MKKLLFTIVFIGIFKGYSQNTSASTQKNMFTVNILTPGIQYEVGLTSKTTLNLGLNTGFAWRHSDFYGTEYGVFLNFETAYRYYYNFERRIQKGKSIANNSGNYLALSSRIASGDPIIGDIKKNVDYAGVIGPVYGIQRTYRSGFNWNIEFGAGYGFDNNESYWSPMGSITIGWVFGKKD